MVGPLGPIVGPLFLSHPEAMPYSSVTYTGTGITGPYSIPFPYIDKSHVKAYVNGAATTAFTWLTSNSIQFSSAVANGVAIVLQRETPRDVRLVDYADATILLADDLDRSDNQNFYIAQELIDAGLLASTDGTLDAGGRRIKNVANGVSAQDAVTVSQLAAAALAPLGGSTLPVAAGGTGQTTLAGVLSWLSLTALSGLSPGTAVGNLVQVQTGGRLPALDASNLINVPASSTPFPEYLFAARGSL